MKSITIAMRDHLDKAVTTLTTCWRIERTDGKVFAFTEGTRDITVDAVVYSSAGGFMRTAISADDSLAVQNLEAVGYFDNSAIKESELRAGLFNYAEVFVFAVNWVDPTAGTIFLHRGRLGEAHHSKAGVFKTELRGISQDFAQVFGEIYTPGCRVNLGSTEPLKKCGVPIIPTVLPRNTFISAPTLTTKEAAPAWRVPDLLMDQTDIDGNADSRVYHDVMFICVQSGTTDNTQPSYNYTIGSQTTDGSAVFEAREAWTRTGLVASVTSGVSFTIDWAYPDSRMVNDCFLDGAVMFESGQNAGANIECKAFSAMSNTIVTYLEGRYTPEIGDRLAVYWGCDHTINGTAGCVLRFQNVRNYQGEPFVPGPDQILFYPDAGGGAAQYTDVTETSEHTGPGKFG